MDWREVRESDLIECLNIQPGVWGDEIVGREPALSVWKRWIRSRSFNSAVIGTNRPGNPDQKVAFGASVFVSCDFVDRELEDRQPGLNSRIIASVISGNSVVLPEVSLADLSACGGLDVVILACNCLYNAMNMQEAVEAEMLLTTSFAETHTGYPLRRILVETVCERQHRFHESSGVWRTMQRFPNSGGALMLLTKSDALSVSGSIAAPLFHYREPALHLREADKQLLAEAVVGATDAELAARMNLSLAAVKKRWASLFAKISDIRPELLPDESSRNGSDVRGPQKRHRILEYVRSHPEEVRPFRWRRHWT